jgi:hypothetical protein
MQTKQNKTPPPTRFLREHKRRVVGDGVVGGVFWWKSISYNIVNETQLYGPH